MKTSNTSYGKVITTRYWQHISNV